MKRTIGLSVLLALITVGSLAAKGPTLKITISGGLLKTPIETTNPDIGRFEVWSGAGLSKHGFIIEWSDGAVARVPAKLELYDVSFHVNHQDKPMAYVVTYAYDPATGAGYVYLPGRSEKHYATNTYLIYRGVEGRWFRATRDWNSFARSLLAG